MVIDQLRGGPAFATRQQRQTIDKDINVLKQELVDKQLIEKELMSNVDSFGGKRFLGLTSKDVPVFAMFTLSKKDMKLNIKFSHNLSVLTREGAKLANDRYSFKHGEKINDYKIMVRKLKKKRGGEVTIQTLRWLQRLKNINDMKYLKAIVNNKPTKTFFTYVSDSMYTGDKINKHMIQKYWKFPTTGNDYFVPESTWKYPDELSS